MRKQIGRVFLMINSFIQVLLMTAIVIVQRLSKYRAGINHHLYYKRVHYQNRLFTSINLIIFTMVIIVVLLLCAFIFRNLYAQKTLGCKIIIVLPCVWCVLLLCFLHIPFFTVLLIYPYLIFAATLVLILMFIDLWICLKIQP